MIKIIYDALLKLLLVGVLLCIYILCISTTDNIFESNNIRTFLKRALFLIVLACEIVVIVTPIAY